MSNINPGVLFGIGTWEQIKDTFLLGVGDKYTSVQQSGGESEHTLSYSEMPVHTHQFSLEDEEGVVFDKERVAVKETARTYVTKGWGDTTVVFPEGGGKAHNNMPPYLTVYMWKRIS